MSDNPEIAVKLQNVGKVYKLYQSPLDALFDVFNFGNMRGKRIQEFWALRDINLNLYKGERLGIVGKNGAGKSTLLKLISQNFKPTEGVLNVNGQVQSLMSSGAGFNPEFTGYENIQASLTYQGYSSEEIPEILADIEDFTELGHFLKQPFKTYSAGMKTRLTFATATAIKPEILIIDEVLGAGDGYFIYKATERLSELIDKKDVTVILVSHATEQVQRFCDRAIWMDGGQIVEEGTPLNIIKSYQQHLQWMNEKRLKAKNILMRTGNRDIAHVGNYTDLINLKFPSSQSGYDIASVSMYEKDKLQLSLQVGGAQDTTSSRDCYIDKPHDVWSEPKQDGSVRYRTLNANSSQSGMLNFNTYMLFSDNDYAFDINYRTVDKNPIEINLIRGQEVLGTYKLPASEGVWRNKIISFDVSDNGYLPNKENEDKHLDHRKANEKKEILRWPGSNRLTIEDVQMLDANAEEKYIYKAGDTIIFRIILQAQEAGIFPVRAGITFFRLDGICITNQVMEQSVEINFQEKNEHHLDLIFDELNLGSGNYVFSASIFENLIVEEERYDLTDRSHEFEVINKDIHGENVIFSHPSRWHLDNEELIINKVPSK